jgi:hypothetical protein
VHTMVKAAAVQISPVLYSRQLLSLLIDRTPAPHVHERTARTNADALGTAGDNEGKVEDLLRRPNVSSHTGGNIARTPEGAPR